MKQLLVLALIALLPACQAAPPAAPAAPVRTSHQPQLAQYEQRDKLDFAWSPDGKRIAMSTWNQVLSFAADGSDRKQLYAGTDLAARGLSWSPDGKQIALLKKRQGEGMSETIHVLNVAGGEPQPLPGPAATTGAAAPAWAKDGRLLYRAIDPAKAGPDKDSHHLGLITAGKATVLFDAEALGSTTLTIHSQAWSHDGKQILLAFSEFAADGKAQSVIAKLDPETRLLRALLSEPGAFHFRAASFSPVDDRILYQQDGGLWMSQDDGSEPVQLATRGSQAQWDSSGQSLVYAEDDATSTASSLRIRNLNEREAQSLSLPTGWIHRLAWSPDDQRVLVGSLQPQRDGTLVEKVYLAGLDGSVKELEP